MEWRVWVLVRHVAMRLRTCLVGKAVHHLEFVFKEDFSEIASVSFITCNEGPDEGLVFLTPPGDRIRSTSQNVVFENKLKLMDSIQNASYV